MNYDVVSTSAQNANQNFRFNDSEFCKNMCAFYREGKKNPSVAKVIMQEQVNKNKERARKLLIEAASYPAQIFIEPQLANATQMFGIAMNSTLKSVEAEDLYTKAGCYTEHGIDTQKEFFEAWETNYPKTGQLRERIIEADRINEEGVTPKVKNWFKRAYYKFLIKGKFHFKK